MDEEGIGKEAVNYFSTLFSADPVGEFRLLHVIPNLRDVIDNKGLEEVPSVDEVQKVIFEMDGDNAAGPDGSTEKFFTSAWEMVAQDIYKAIVSFFCGEELSCFITATSIVLLPKVMNPKDFTQFRPISVSNFLNKVISRILVGRFSGGNLALKLDIVKAYDRVFWMFIITVLRQFGFSERFIDMVWRLISNVWFSVLVNGVPHGFFKSSRGMRSVGCTVPRHCPPVSHLAFANDVMVFANGSAAALKRIMRVLEWYQNDSGQLVNVQKSGYLVHPWTSSARTGVIEQVTKFQRKQFPIRHLGAPLFVGRAKEVYYSDLCQTVLDKIFYGEQWARRRNSIGSDGGTCVTLQKKVGRGFGHSMTRIGLSLVGYGGISGVAYPYGRDSYMLSIARGSTRAKLLRLA
nr:uncharacterized protein LOC113739257 [Coffea arabica]